MKTRYGMRGWLCAAALLAPGCISLDGLKLNEDAGDAAKPDEGDNGWAIDAEPSEPDASRTGPDASWTEPELDADVSDAGRDTGAPAVDTGVIGCLADCTRPGCFVSDCWGPGPGVDASPEDAGAETGPEPQVSCTSNAGCAADQVCGPSATCMPKCDGFGRCVVAVTTGRVAALAVDEDALYWLTYPSRDALGNVRADAEISRMRPGQVASRLIGGIGAHYDGMDEFEYWAGFTVKAGYVYYRNGRALYRCSVQPESTAQLLYAIPGTGQARWVVGDGFIAIASSAGIALGDPDGGAPLRTLYGSSVLTDGHGPPLAAVNDRIYFGASSGGTFNSLRFIRLVEPYLVEENAFVSTGWFDTIVDPYLYQSPARIDLRDGSRQFVVKGRELVSNERTAVHGDWIYQSVAGVSYEYSPEMNVRWLSRYSLRSVGTAQELIPEHVVSDLTPELMAPVGERLYMAPQFNGVTPGGIVYEMLLPPPPCAADLPCSDGKTCGADRLCH